MNALKPKTSPSGIEYRICSSAEEQAETAARLLVESARRAIDERGSFSVALSGGSTPIRFHRLLASAPHRDEIDWPKVYVFFGDDRSVGPDHEDSNYRMARETLLDHVPLAADRIYRMEGEMEDLEEAARRYAANLRQVLPSDDSGMPIVDFLVQGLGPDGHTASLFPGTAALDESGSPVVANDVPQLSTRRLTMTLSALNAAREAVFLIAGKDKAPAVAEILSGRDAANPLPGGLLRPIHGKLLWLLDQESAGGLG